VVDLAASSESFRVRSEASINTTTEILYIIHENAISKQPKQLADVQIPYVRKENNRQRVRVFATLNYLVDKPRGG